VLLWGRDAEGHTPSASGVRDCTLNPSLTRTGLRITWYGLKRTGRAGIVRPMTQGERASAIDLDRLHSDLAQAKERVRGLEELIALAERWYGESDQPPATRNAPAKKPPSNPPSTPAEPTEAEGLLAGLGAREAAVQLLKMRGGTWKVDQATKEMLRLGWRTNSPAPETVVRSALMRDRRIERPAPGEFRYRQEPGSSLLPEEPGSSLQPVEPSPNGDREGQPPTNEPDLYPVVSTGS
jgi:hypothetical protein